MQHEYEIEYKGRTIKCRTAEAMTRLLRLIETEDTAKEYIPWSLHDFLEFTGRIQISQRKLLARLIELGSAWLTDERLRNDLYLGGNQALAGVLSGVSKVAMALDIEPQRVYMSRTRYAGGKPQRMYRIAPAFLRIAVENSWPGENDLKW
jgi:hypothetical protein